MTPEMQRAKAAIAIIYKALDELHERVAEANLDMLMGIPLTEDYLEYLETMANRFRTVN